MIIEDDHFSARRLKRLIMDIDDTIDVHGPLKSVAEVTEELAANNDYDLIFSDIRLADGDVFEAFRKVMPQSFVIFTTAYDEYAMEAIKNNGLDYLMKPIDADELRAAIGKLQLNRNAQQSAVERPLHGVYFSSKLIVRLKGCEDENIVISKEKATLFKKWLEK